MKRLSSARTEMLNDQVKKFVDAYNSWDEEQRELYVDDMAYVTRRVLMYATYVCGWIYNSETGKYEREENNA